MEKIWGFLSEYGELLFCLLPLLVILGILLGVFIKMLVRNPKSMLGAVFAVLGVIALLTVPAFFVGEDLWGELIYIVPACALLIWFAVKHPKRMLKFILIILAVSAVLVGIAFLFGAWAAIMAGLNGMMVIFPICAFKDLRRTLWLNKNGTRTAGEVINISFIRGGKVLTFGYTAKDGTYFKQEIGGICSMSRAKLHDKYTLIYDPKDPADICAEKYSLIADITNFVLFALLEAGIFGATIYMIIVI